MAGCATRESRSSRSCAASARRSGSSGSRTRVPVLFADYARPSPSAPLGEVYMPVTGSCFARPSRLRAVERVPRDGIGLHACARNLCMRTSLPSGDPRRAPDAIIIPTSASGTTNGVANSGAEATEKCARAVALDSLRATSSPPARGYRSERNQGTISPPSGAPDGTAVARARVHAGVRAACRLERTDHPRPAGLRAAPPRDRVLRSLQAAALPRRHPTGESPGGSLAARAVEAGHGAAHGWGAGARLHLASAHRWRSDDPVRERPRARAGRPGTLRPRP